MTKIETWRKYLKKDSSGEAFESISASTDGWIDYVPEFTIPSVKTPDIENRVARRHDLLTGEMVKNYPAYETTPEPVPSLQFTYLNTTRWTDHRYRKKGRRKQ